ncbi:hypothetical protein MKW92_005133, partial [Papaver armeniacum]
MFHAGRALYKCLQRYKLLSLKAQTSWMHTLGDTILVAFRTLLLRKELARHLRTNSSADNREAPRNSRNGFFSLMLGEALESDQPNFFVQFLFVMLSCNGFPVQFEDIFLT